LNLRINRKKTYQSIIGFGGAITDAAGSVIYSLSQGSIENILKSYFDQTGIEYNILRVPMSGTDFSLRVYSYDDNPKDFNLTKFSLVDEDIYLKIPFIKSALKLSQKNLKIFSSSWSAPPWMKTNNDYIGKGKNELY
jgi:glucosylceramidase